VTVYKSLDDLEAKCREVCPICKDPSIPGNIHVMGRRKLKPCDARNGCTHGGHWVHEEGQGQYEDCLADSIIKDSVIPT
jgi:hypothetical protein